MKWAVSIFILASALAQAQHQALLKWKASATSPVLYRIYRSQVSGGPYSMIASRITVPIYADKSVTSKHTYFYVVNCRSLKTDLVSKFSNEVKAVIP